MLLPRGTTVERRRAAIVRLLRTRDENLPEPRHRSEVPAGFVNKPRGRTCPDCLANGRVMKTCETCGGFGVVEGGRLANVAAPDELPDDGSRRDPYASNAVVPYGFDATRHDAAHERDRQIEMLGRQTRPAAAVDELADANDHPYGWELARQQMYRRFDYGALDAALEQLRIADDDAYRALHAVYVYGWQPEPSTGPLHDACEIGLGFVDERMPDELRAPELPPDEPQVRGPISPAAGAVAKELRASQMLERAGEGATPAEIAAEFRVSLRTVYRTINDIAA